MALYLVNRMLRSRTLPFFSWDASLFSFRLFILRTIGFVGWVKYYLKFYGESLNYICIFDVIKYYFPWHDIDEVNRGLGCSELQEVAKNPPKNGKKLAD